MKAIILAGGVGSRLRPMTCDCPKPMVPVMGMPAMEHAVRLLKKHGVEEIAVTLCYLPGQIREYFGSGSRFGVKMRYYMENEPLGTAGGVKLAQEFLDEPFFVLSGDGVTDCDLSAAYRFHCEKKAAATILLKEAAVPTEYGVAVTEKSGRIRHFLEKPDWSDVLSDRVNTGAYILEKEALEAIPEGKQADFSRDLFPKLLKSEGGVYGWPMQGYWCDIGDVESYLGAHRAALGGQARLQAGFEAGKITVHESARVAENARLEAPCCIGPGAVVESGALIGAGSYVGAGARIGKGACVKRSVLWPGAVMEENAQASGCVLCDGALLEKNACAYEGSVVGKGSVLGAGAVLAPGARIWPGKRIEEHSRVQRDIVWGSGCALKFRNGRLKLYGAQQAFRLGQTAAKLLPAPVAAAFSGEEESPACYAALLAGLTGETETIDIGRTPLPALRETGRLLRAGSALYCAGSRVLLLGKDGAAAERGLLRAVEKELCAEQMPRGFAPCALPERFGGALRLYLGGIGAQFSFADRPVRASAVCPDPEVLSLARLAFAQAGAEFCAQERGFPGMPFAGTSFSLDADGVLESAADPTAVVQGEQLSALLLWTALEAGERKIPLSQGAPDMQRGLCRSYGAHILPVHSGAGEEQQAMAASCPMLLRLHTDGIYAALAILRALEARGAQLLDWQALLPRTALVSQDVPVETARKGKVLRALAERFPQAELGDGVLIGTEHGRIWVRPSSDSAECRVHCEAADMESARALMERCLRIISAQD